jgi:hypothetical protein
MVRTGPEVVFINGAFLGCISYDTQTAPSLICLHEMLNSPDVPHQVFRHILIHELIHLIVAAREIDGKMTSHLLEFWELEKDFSPDRRGGVALAHEPIWSLPD